MPRQNILNLLACLPIINKEIKMSKIVLTAVLFFPLLPSFHAEGQDEKRFQMTATDQAFYRVVTDFNLLSSVRLAITR